MTADELKKMTSDALDHLAALLDEGHSGQLTALLRTMAQFDKYSWHNVCLIARQRPTATHVAGFQTWRTLRRFVRKGEKGIAILAPIVGRREEEVTSEEIRTVLGFRAAYVFDVEQTDGEPLPAPTEATGDPGAATEMLKASVLARGIAIDSVDDLGGALGTSSGGRIQLLRGSRPPWSSQRLFMNTPMNSFIAWTIDSPRVIPENWKPKLSPSPLAPPSDSTSHMRRATTFTCTAAIARLLLVR
jgi:N-terminal domain of anti-restriction factor ArdC